VYVSVCLFVFLSVFPHDISQTDAARITKLDTEMFHHESWKLINFAVKISKVKVTRHKKHSRHGSWRYCSCECWLILAYTATFMAPGFPMRTSTPTCARRVAEIAESDGRDVTKRWLEGAVE